MMAQQQAMPCGGLGVARFPELVRFARHRRPPGRHRLLWPRTRELRFGKCALGLRGAQRADRLRGPRKL